MKNKIKYNWNLKLLYKNDKDPQIEKDIIETENICKNFNKKYSNKDFSNKKELLKAVRDFEILTEKISSSKPLWYFSLREDIESSNKYVNSQKIKIGNRLNKAINETLFFEIRLGQLDTKIQKELLKDEDFKDYKYFLERIFKDGKYKLSEKEEKLQNLLNQTSYDMWVDGNEKLIKNQTIDFNNEKIPISKAFNIISSENIEKRRELQKKINEKLKEIGFFAEAEINAVFNYKKIDDENRGFKNPYSSTVLAYENEEKNIENLVDLITKNFKISHRFYKLHKKILGIEKLKYEDRSVKIGDIEKNFSFEDSVKLICSSLEKFDPKYKDMFLSFIENGQVDINTKIGKYSGAYCSGRGQMPTFILLNHSDNIRSVETIAHEMGHGIHTELSKSQKVFYRGYCTSTAEVASTFFEQLLQEDLERTLSEKEKVVFLHNKILVDISTIFRQIAFFNFEKELHQEIRKSGYLSKEEISKILTKHFKSYLGNSFDIEDDDGLFFVTLSHIRSFFYVYSYAYGQIISKALLSKWKEDNSFKSKIEQFLKAGKSKSPEDIFKNIGIDTSKEEFFLKGLKSIEEDIRRLEKLTK